MTIADQVDRRSMPKKTDGRLERDRLRMMMLIRRFEERTYKEYQSVGQKIGGFCHLYSGQEAIAVGTAAIFDPSKDYLINGYRCHGHSLALGMSPHAAMAELFGKATGCSKGKGGSMHLFQAEVGNNGGHGIVGGQLPLGAGMAFAQWYKKTGGATFCFMGDGAINQGTFNESLNLASLYKLPVIYIVENNGVAMGTQVERSSAEKDLVKRGSGFAMPNYAVDGNDLDVIVAEFSKAKERAVTGEGPSYIVANTFRFRGHSMSDPLKYRTKEEHEKAKLRDPITLYADRLKSAGLVNDEQLQEIEQSVAQEVDQATKQADADPFPDLDARFDDVLTEKYPFEPK
jgi:pyruvate dehydrogenase E1 component alpha subunit